MDILCGEDGIGGWNVTLADGGKVWIWADSYGRENGELVFGVLVDASDKERALLPVGSSNQLAPTRVVLTVAKFPEASVVTVSSMDHP